MVFGPIDRTAMGPFSIPRVLTIVPNMAGSAKAESPKAVCSIQSDPLQILALIAAMVFSWSANFGDFAGSGLA